MKLFNSILGLLFCILASSLCLGFLLYISLPDIVSNSQKSFQIIFLITFVGLLLFILFLPRKWGPRPKSNIRNVKKEIKNKEIKNAVVSWKISAIIICGLLGVIFYILGMIHFEPSGFNPFYANHDQIKSIKLTPSGSKYTDLLESPIYLTEKKQIKIIANALNTAVPIQPNHPGAQWRCDLTIETNSETITVEISDTKGSRNGVLVYWWSPNMKLNLGPHRCDEISPILEHFAVLHNKVNKLNERLAQLKLK